VITAKHIPDEVEKAAAKQIACSRLPEYEWIDLDDEMKASYRAEARATIIAALEEWPGAVTEPRNWRTALILPLQEKSNG
jgi:hypothetical protein